MKKICCLLLVLACNFIFPALADEPVTVSCSLSDSTGHISVTADLFEDEGCLYLLSSLCPDHFLIIAREKDPFYFNPVDLMQLTPESIKSVTEAIYSAFLNEAERRLSPVRYGLFTGDAFDSARSERKASFVTGDFLIMLNRLSARKDTDKNNEQATRLMAGVSEYLGRFFSFLSSGDDTGFILKEYDEGKYASLDIFDDRGAIMTVSADLSSGTGYKTVTGYSKGGTVYHRVTDIFPERKLTVIHSALYAGTEGFRKTQETKSPLFTEQLLLSETAENGYLFEYTLNAASLSEPLHVNGEALIAEGTPQLLHAKIFIEGREDQALDISICLRSAEEQPFSALTDGKKELNTDEREDAEEFRRILWGRLSVMFAEILPNLPSDYQFLITQLLLE